MNIKILFAEGFEETEAITLVDLLRRAKYDVKTVSVTGNKNIKGGHDIIVTSDSIIDTENFEDTDLLLLPGGSTGVKNLAADSRVIELLKDFRAKDKYIGAICAAPLVLYKAGVLKDKTYTCYPGTQDEIKDGKYIEDSVVVDGKLITSRGVGTAIDMGLKLVELFSSKKESDELKNRIVYNR